jgi:hypothetical protein
LVAAAINVVRVVTWLNDIPGFDHRVGHFRPLRIAARILEYPMYLMVRSFGSENRQLGWPTP